MKRSRSALARHRKRKLQEATAHVSDAHDLDVVAEIAGAVSMAHLATQLQQEGDAAALSRDSETVNIVIRALRNVKNSVYHRAMAARALGLFMLEEPSLVARLGFESEDLLDALLQLINCSRRFERQNADTRRVHVNCSLVISMLMRITQHEHQPQRLQLVVNLDSELLAMPRHPTEPTSKFLLLTIGGRPEYAFIEELRGERIPLGSILPKSKIPPCRIVTHPRDLSHLMNQPSPPTPRTQKKRTDPLASCSGSVPTAQAREESSMLSATIERRQTPSRHFKMERFRVITPALVPSTSGQHSCYKPIPVILPSRYQAGATPASNNNQIDSSLRLGEPATSLQRAPSASASLLSGESMVEIFRTGSMPVAAATHFHQHLSEEDSEVLKANRIEVVEWGEWRRGKSGGEHGTFNGDGQFEGLKVPHLSKPSEILDFSTGTAGNTRRVQHATANYHTPEYKRERLREILSSPIEPFERNTAHLHSLHYRQSTATMVALDTKLSKLRDSEARTRQQTRSFIEQERDKLPLKFLFQLPGGAAYCRDRMSKAMSLWVMEFEANQKRMALLQWKACVEQYRFQLRGQAYHRQAIEKCLKAAIEYVLRGYQQQAFKQWVKTVQIVVWLHRDAATRKIQRQFRRYIALVRFLELHDENPFGGVFHDVYLAPPREDRGVPFYIPRRVREERRQAWFSAELVQGVYRKRRFRKFLKRYRVAATKIQARVRMRIHRARYHILKKRIIVFQSWIRMQHHYRVYHALRRAAILVQTNFRSLRTRRTRQLVLKAKRRAVERRLTCALLIQRVARGFLGRNEANRHRQEQNERFHAALIVQRAWYRRNNEWSTFLLLGCLREKEIEETTFDKQVVAFKRQFMAKQIQHVWKCYREGYRNRAALLVQRNVRRWIATSFVQQMRLEEMSHRRIKWFFRVRHAHRIHYANKLQFWWLRSVPGRLTHHLRCKRLMLEAAARHDTFNREQLAATGIQSGWRGRRDRLLAMTERSARVIQLAARGFIGRQRIKHELCRLKVLCVSYQVQLWITAGSERVFESRIGRLDAAATQIQRLVRGFLCRLRLIRLLVQTEERQRMAIRIQKRWRQSAHARVAQRVLIAQRRRRNNPFREVDSISGVIRETACRVNTSYDPDDELQGLHPAAWLKRLGLDEENYMPIFEKHYSGEKNVIAQLRACEDTDSCLQLLARVGIDDDGDAQLMVTNLFAARTLKEVRQIRCELENQRRCLREDEKRIEFVQQQLHHADEELARATEQLEEVLLEASGFRNPPKALRSKRELLARQLEYAQRAYTSIEHRNDTCEQRVSQRRRDIRRLQDVLALRDKDEVSGLYSLQNFRLIHQLNIARELFLRKFPGLEARALAFVGALEEGQVSTWQLLRFFQSNATISQVKTSMVRLTYFKFENDVRKHELTRYQTCADDLLYGFERVCELLEIPVDTVALEGSLDHCQLDATKTSLQLMALTSIFDFSKFRRPRDRVLALAERLRALQKMDIVATRIQTQWRRRAASKVMLVLKSARLKRQLREKYIAEVNADYVTPIWREEREGEKQEYEQWLKEDELAAREEALLNVLRFPWQEEWDENSQTWTVFRLQAKCSGEDGMECIYTDERPIYSVEEENAVIRIQCLARRYISRLELHKRRRLQQRDSKRQEMERMWQTRCAERARAVTLRLTIAMKADERVSLWIGHRRDQQQRTKTRLLHPSMNTPVLQSSPVSHSRRRRNALERDDEERSKLKNAEIIRIFEAELGKSGALHQCEATFHRGVRSEHRRNMLFPGNARPPNPHAEVLREFLTATQKFERSLALRTETMTRLEYTLVALPYRWLELTDGTRPYYFNPVTQETSWDRPRYAFDHEYAAIKIQSLARVLLAQLEKTRLLADVSFVRTIHSTLQQAAKVGWVGYGLEGISASVFLSRLGLAKYNAALASLSVDEIVRLSEKRMQKLGWTREEMATIRTSVPPRMPRRKFPLTSCQLAITPTSKHPYNFLPSERVVHQIVSQSLPNQQGRVVGLVRAIKESSTPISYRQLEMHLRLYAGRPDDAIAHIGDIASLPYATQAYQESQIMSMFLRCLEKCIVYAANLGLRALHEELSVALFVAAALLQPSGTNDRVIDAETKTTGIREGPYCPDDKTRSLARAGLLASPATPLASLGKTQLSQGVASVATATRRRFVKFPAKGLWEHDCTLPGASTLSAAQVALYLREYALERVLLWWRSAAITQATFRMHRVRDWYRSVIAFRRHNATTIQCTWRSYCALEMRRLLESQQRSSYEQRLDKMTKTFFFVYNPTNEKLMDEPRDAKGAMLPYRPMVQDRMTKRWMLAWPGLADTRSGNTSKSTTDGGDDWGLDVAPCSICHVERAVRRCNECCSSSGDFVDYCLACFFDRHDASEDLAWHTFTALHRLKTRAFHCVECKRFSTMRCLTCREHYCERCFLRVHHKGHTRARHTCEHYESMAAVCVECEANVAFQKCLVCLDALCEDCMTRTHKRGAKNSHPLQLVKQAIEEGHIYCEQCHARRGDASCTFCAMTLCHVCLADPTKHGAACPETELHLKKKQLLRDRLCVECGKPADRECEKCGDKYCSVKWMGNPGCFERFHWKGKRADHTCVSLPGVAAEMPPEILELEDKVKQKRRRDAEEAERVARAMAAALVVTAADATTRTAGSTESPGIRKRTRRGASVGASKRRLLGTATARLVCSVENCGKPTLSAAVPFCSGHLTSQHALEITKEDPLEAAKLLAVIEKHGGKLPAPPSGFWSRQAAESNRSSATREATGSPGSTTKNEKAKKSKRS